MLTSCLVYMYRIISQKGNGMHPKLSSKCIATIIQIVSLKYTLKRTTLHYLKNSGEACHRPLLSKCMARVCYIFYGKISSKYAVP